MLKCTAALQKKLCFDPDVNIYQEDEEMTEVLKSMPNKYAQFKTSHSMKKCSKNNDAGAGPILFGVRSEYFSFCRLPVRISSRIDGFDGVSELEKVLLDAEKFSIVEIKVQKYIFVEANGVTIDLSLYTRPSIFNSSGRKLLVVLDRGSYYSVSRCPLAPTHHNSPREAAESLLKQLTKGIEQAPPQQQIIVGAVHVVPAILHPAPLPPLHPGQGQGAGAGAGLQAVPVAGPDHMVYGANPDIHTRHDRHGQQVAMLQQLLTQTPLTQREVRDIEAGPGHIGYAANPSWNKSIRSLIHPQILEERRFKDTYGLSKQHFYQFCHETVAPALTNIGLRPSSGNVDTVAAAFLYKMKKDPSFRDLARQLGNRSPSTPQGWFWAVLNHIYDFSPILVLNRNLGQGNNLFDLLNEASDASNRSPRFRTFFEPVLAHWIANHPGQPIPRLVGLSWDSRVVEIPHLSDFDKQRRTHSTKVNDNGILKLIATGTDGRAYFNLVLSNCCSPANTDRMISEFLLRLEMDPNNNLSGGLLTIFNGLPGFKTIHFFDKGFKNYMARRQQGQTFLQMFRANIMQQNNDLPDYRIPLDARDRYWDRNGVLHDAPVPHVNAPPQGRLLFARQANSTRFTTVERHTVEHYHGGEWGWEILGCRSAIDAHYLDPYGRGPTPNVPKISPILQAHFDIQWRFQQPAIERCPIPPGLSVRILAEITVARSDMENWLDPLVTGLPSGFARDDLFQKPTQVQLMQAMVRGSFGQVRFVDIFNHQLTGFPDIPFINLYEMAGGEYLVNLIFKYVTSLHVKACDRNIQYLNLAHYMQIRTQAPVTLQGWLFDQVVQPADWNDQEYGNFEPMRIVAIPNIPSRYINAGTHTVLIAYVPVNWPLQFPALGYHHPGLQRIKMILCGPRQANTGCPSGARTSPPCAHGHVATYLMGTLPRHPGLFRSTFRKLFLLDTAQDQHFSLDILHGLMH